MRQKRRHRKASTIYVDWMRIEWHENAPNERMAITNQCICLNMCAKFCVCNAYNLHIIYDRMTFVKCMYTCASRAFTLPYSRICHSKL